MYLRINFYFTYFRDLAKILIRHAKDIIAPLNNEFCEDQEVQSLPVNTDVSAGGNNQAGGNIQAANPGGNNQAANTGGSNQAGGNIQASNAGGNIQTANAGGSTQTANTEWNNQKGTTPFRELIRRMPGMWYCVYKMLQWVIIIIIRCSL